MTTRNYYHYCYLTTNLVNGMKYFGVRSAECPPEEDHKYMGTGTKILAAIKEHGKKSFSKEVLAVFDTRDEADEFEENYLATNDYVDDPNYYNVSARSTGGRFDYHEELKDGLTSSPQEKNGAQKNFGPKPAKGESHILPGEYNPEAASVDLRDTSTREVPGMNRDGSPDLRTHHNGQMGGKRPGAGRPKGSKSIFSKQSVEKLQELGFDPMEELYATYVQVCQDIENTRSISARTALYNTRQKIMSDLMKYGYRPVPTREEKSVEIEDKGPMSIVLTDVTETPEEKKDD